MSWASIKDHCQPWHRYCSVTNTDSPTDPKLASPPVSTARCVDCTPTQRPRERKREIETEGETETEEERPRERERLRKRELHTHSRERDYRGRETEGGRGGGD